MGVQPFFTCNPKNRKSVFLSFRHTVYQTLDVDHVEQHVSFNIKRSYGMAGHGPQRLAGVVLLEMSVLDKVRLYHKVCVI